ncbi:MAG: PQQ-binding-like beta-propeller repeat protein [Phycisphaerae bacterium]|jgi:outer membrane protein assembly factor BamB|nr:PQQ-binding-like beta-propeller repeat protein [Phycisphaerae bacterium]
MNLPAKKSIALCVLLMAASLVRAENWPQWRGPNMNGTSTEKNLPSTWSKTENIVWSAPMPGPTAGTPIIWGDRVFTTAANKSKELLAICVDASSGKILWSDKAGKDRKTAGSNHNMASPSPVTDGKSVFFLFGTGDIVAYDFKGKRLWSRDIEKDYGPFIMKWGYGSSPLLYDGKVYVLVMHNKVPGTYGVKGHSAGVVDSYLLALDAVSGKTLWKHVRPTDAKGESTESYSTPLLCEIGGRKEIVIHSSEFATGHDPKTGKELWRWQFVPHGREKWQRTVSSATAGDGVVYFGRPRWRGLYAIRPSNTGLLKPEAMLWKHDKYANDASTPLLYGGRLYVLCGKTKTIACLAPRTGKVLWAQKLDVKSQFRSSPTGADGKIYFTSMNGDVFVLKAGDEFKQLAKIEMGGRNCLSTISVSAGRLYIRLPGSLYCIALGSK